MRFVVSVLIVYPVLKQIKLLPYPEVLEHSQNALLFILNHNIPFIMLIVWGRRGDLNIIYFI